MAEEVMPEREVSNPLPRRLEDEASYAGTPVGQQRTSVSSPVAYLSI